MFNFVDVKYKTILDLSTLNIDDEKITTFVGASGSGKTTILKLLNKMISPTQGKVLFDGVDLSQINSVMHRRNVIMLSQNSLMFEGSIRDNLNIGLKFHGKEQQVDEVLNGILEKVKLNKKLDTSVNILSGGEKQRIALGRVLLLDSKIYLLDEPSSSLDDETEDMIIQMLIENIRDKGKTIVMVTHSKAIAKKYSDVIIEISDGKCLNCLEVG